MKDLLYASRSLSRKYGDIVTQPIHLSGFCPVSDPYVIWIGTLPITIYIQSNIQFTCSGEATGIAF